MDLETDGARLGALVTVARGTGGRHVWLSHQTAAGLLDIDLLHDSPTPHLTTGRNRSRLQVPGAVVHRRDMRPGDWLQLGRHRLPVTSGVRTVVDLARDLSHVGAVVAADSALRARRVAPAELDAALAGLRGGGAAKVRAVLERADGRSGSPFESVSRMLCQDAGVGPVIPQLAVWPGGHSYDLGLPERRTVIECQSLEFHRTREQLELDARWINEAYAAGWRYLQLTWDLVMVHPEAGRRAVLGLR